MSPAGNWGRGRDGTEPIEANEVVFEFVEGGHGAMIRASVSTFRGRERLDLRQWMEIDGELRPTKKGISVPVDFLPELEQAVAALRQAVDPEGIHAPRKVAVAGQERVA